MINHPTSSNTITETRETFFARLLPFATPTEIVKVQLAYMMAKFGHRSQVRKELDKNNNPMRYFEHVRRVALVLLDELHIQDINLICAALLHDTLEDTKDIHAEMIEQVFGTRVCRMVKLLSKLPKEGYYERLISHGDVDIWTIKGADRLDNLRSAAAGGDAFHKRQLRDTWKYMHEMLVPTQVRQQVMGIYNRLQNNQSPFPQHSLARLHEVGNGNLMMNNNNGNGMAQPRGQQFSDDASQGAQGCKVMEGFPAYHPIQSQGFGGAVPLVRAVGMTNSAISMQQFIVRGTVRAFVVPPNQKVVDMAMLQTRPDLLCELVELQAPPMSSLGNILVPKEAIARMAQQGMPAYGNKHLLGDSRAGIRPGQNMGGNRIVTGNGNGMAGKRILTG